MPPLPAHWPHTLQLGLAQSPGDVRGRFGFRYQYLAAGWTGELGDGVAMAAAVIDDGRPAAFLERLRERARGT